MRAGRQSEKYSSQRRNIARTSRSRIKKALLSVEIFSSIPKKFWGHNQRPQNFFGYRAITRNALASLDPQGVRAWLVVDVDVDVDVGSADVVQASAARPWSPQTILLFLRQAPLRTRLDTHTVETCIIYLMHLIMWECAQGSL